MMTSVLARVDRVKIPCIMAEGQKYKLHMSLVQRTGGEHWPSTCSLLLYYGVLPGTNDQMAFSNGTDNISPANDTYQFVIAHDRNTLDLALTHK
jgi:hypothetical protein